MTLARDRWPTPCFGVQLMTDGQGPRPIIAAGRVDRGRRPLGAFRSTSRHTGTRPTLEQTPGVATFLPGRTRGLVPDLESRHRVWVHWIFGLRHITEAREDVILEPLFVLIKLGFMRFGLTRARHHGH